MISLPNHHCLFSLFAAVGFYILAIIWSFDPLSGGFHARNVALHLLFYWTKLHIWLSLLHDTLQLAWHVTWLILLCGLDWSLATCLIPKSCERHCAIMKTFSIRITIKLLLSNWLYLGQACGKLCFLSLCYSHWFYIEEWIN